MTAVLQAERLYRFFHAGDDETLALRGVSLDVSAGEVVAVTGKVRRNAVERYVFFHGGRDVVLTLSGPAGADNVDPWKLVTDSLRWKS